MTDEPCNSNRYRYLAVQLGEPFARIAEVPLVGVSYERRRNSAGTFSGKLKMPNIAEEFLVDGTLVDNSHDVLRARTYKQATEAGVTCIYVLRDNTPLGGWIVWEQNYDEATQAITVSGSEFMSYFTRRTVSDENPTATVTYQNKTASAAARDLLGAHNGIGLQFDDADANYGAVVAERVWKGSDAKAVAEVVKQLADGSDGFEWRTLVRRTQDDYERVFYARPSIGGQVGAIAVVGQNVQSLTASVAGTKRVSDVVAFGGGNAEPRPLGQASEPLALTPRLTGVLQHTDVIETATLQQLAEADVAINVYPESLTLEVVVSDGGIDLGAFNPGDLVRLRVPPRVSPWWPDGIDRTPRAIGITVDVPDTGGAETVTIALEGDRDD